MEISFKTKDHPESKSIQYDLPETLEGLTEKFGAESVLNAARSSYIIGLQAFCRRHIEKDVEEIQRLADDWNPNERAAAVKLSPFERATKALSGLSDEERAELLARLQG